MASSDYETVRAFLTDERFARLRRLADRGILLWEDVRDNDVPPGYTKEQVWDILCIVRRQTAVELPWDTFTDKGYAGKGWFATTRALSSALERIEALAAAGSDLTRRVASHRGSAPLMARVYQDVVGALALCGRDVPLACVQAAFKGDDARTDSASTDLLLRNFVAAYADLATVAAQRLSPWSIEHLYHRLTEGLDPAQDARAEPELAVRRYGPSIYADPDVTLKTISEILEGRTGGDPYHPVLRIMHAQWFFWVNRPFEAWNPLVEVLVRHAACARFGYPALAYVPLAHLQGAWVAGTLAEPRSPAELFSHLAAYKDDYTPFYLVLLDLVLKDLDELLRLLDWLERRDKELARTLDDAFFNVRQRAILSNALNNPEQPQRIEPHRRSYRVSYATARKDFLDLEAGGYLRREEVGKAFVFLPTAKLLDAYGG